ncbi:MAG: iron-sulfur cluster repair di-iron protein [Cytophagales bacterium]|nr:iron-sulfur cluster repair di-iron protein [Cytophagales bacterium]
MNNKTIAELVSNDYRKAEVFRSFGIDFCCGGKRTVEEVCEKKKINYDDLKDKLRKIEQKSPPPEQINFKDWNMDLLVDYIVNEHHKYVRDNIPLLLEYTQKVAKVHGNANPEVVQIAELFKEIAEELDQHMMKEESILFPYIKQLAEAETNCTPIDHPPFGTVQNPIRMMELEHDHAGEVIKEIRKLSNGYIPPDYACNTYQVSYFKLKEFEEDLHRHIHLENNILFPKAITLETRFTNP